MIEWLAGLDPQGLLLGFAALGIGLALPLVVIALGRLRRLRLATGTLYILLGAVVALLGVAAGLTAASLRTYQRLTHEQLAARVSIRQLGERHFALTLQAPAQTPRQFEVRGDEWQIDARVLKWRGLATLAGFDTVYRLDRLSGRYADIAQERSASRTVYALSPEPGLDLWSVLRRHNRFVPFADALYGSAAYVPLAQDASYAVTVSAFGLVVRPENSAARRALSDWR